MAISLFHISGEKHDPTIKVCKRIILLFLIWNMYSYAAMNDPFPAGYSMLNFGTILQVNSVSGRQPWIPACFALDTVLYSISSSYINYYAAMDNLRDEDFTQVTIGFWLNPGKISIKCSGTFFDALEIYYERKGFLSLGVSIFKRVNISAEFEAYRIGLLFDKSESESVVSTGVSLWVPWSFASASFSCKNIIIEQADHQGFAQPLSLAFGIHTMPYGFGSQGVVITVEPGKQKNIRFCLGEEYRIFRIIALSAAVSTNPLMVSFGITFSRASYGIYTGFVHNPVLGWSQGVGMEYVK